MADSLKLPKGAGSSPKREFPMAKMRELEQMEQLLEAEEKELRDKLIALKQKKKELLEQEIAFKEKKLKHDNFIQECEIRRQRAETIVREEKEKIHQQQKEIIALQSQMKELQTQKDDILKNIKESKVNQFLEKIVEASNGEFKQSKEVIMKYESLQNVLQKLWEQQKEVQRLLREEKMNFFQFITDQKSEILRQNLVLSLAKDKAMKMELEMIDLQNELDDAIRTETEQRLQYEKAKMSIANMVQLIEKHCNKKINTNDPVNQMLKIQQYIEDLRYIIAEVGKSERADSDFPQEASSRSFKRKVHDLNTNLRGDRLSRKTT